MDPDGFAESVTRLRIKCYGNPLTQKAFDLINPLGKVWLAWKQCA